MPRIINRKRKWAFSKMGYQTISTKEIYDKYFRNYKSVLS